MRLTALNSPISLLRFVASGPFSLDLLIFSVRFAVLFVVNIDSVLCPGRISLLFAICAIPLFWSPPEMNIHSVALNEIYFIMDETLFYLFIYLYEYNY